MVGTCMEVCVVVGTCMEICVVLGICKEIYVCKSMWWWAHVWRYMYGGLCGGRLIYGGQRTTCRGQFSPLTMWISGSNLAASTGGGCPPARPFPWPKSLLLNCTTYDICLGISGKGYLMPKRMDHWPCITDHPSFSTVAQFCLSEIFLSLLSL